MNHAEALNCPNCGAAVSSDKTVCEFCRSRLKTVACPECLGLMFMGSEFCGHCGTAAVKAESFSEADPGKCPRCKVNLNILKIEETALLECERCDGIWSDVTTFEKICTERESQSAVLGFIETRPRTAATNTKVSYVPCPKCSTLMNRSNFARSSGVIIDVCKHHGVWFDPDELPKIIGFIRKGGMELAREKERISIKDERDRLKDEVRKQAMFDQRFGTGNDWERDDRPGILSFIEKLFD
jgi:Zn-finger nucleic acid-binding protein